MPDALDVEVLVVSYDSAETLVACLTSVERHMPGTPIAIREHGTDPTASAALDALAARHPTVVRIERDPTNPGFGAGCNALAAGSTAHYLLFLNPDAEIACWPYTTDDPPSRPAIVGPLMIDSGHPGAHAGTSFRVRDEIARSWLRRRGALPAGRGFVSGAALLIDRPSFERLGGFDEGYFLFYEDIDLCLRANDLGVPTHLDRRWTVRHAGAHSTAPRFGQSLEWSYESAARFHGGRGSPLWAYRMYVIADALLRSVMRAARRDRRGARAYVRLSRRVAGDLAGRRSGRTRTGRAV